MGSKNGKYTVEHEGSIQSENKTLPAPVSNSNGSKGEASLPTLIHQESLVDLSSSNTTNLTLVWLDTEINNRPSNIDTQIKLKNLINYLRIFDEIDACERYIEQICETNNTGTMHEERLLVIISTTLALAIIPHFHDLPQVKYIYIYGKTKLNVATTLQLLTNYKKVKGIFSTSQSLLARITQDQN